MIGDVNKSIVQIDFLFHFHLLVYSKNCKLIDGITSLSFIGDSYYDFVSSIIHSIQNQYEVILKQFSDFLRLTIANYIIKSHNIEHVIETKGCG